MGPESFLRVYLKHLLLSTEEVREHNIWPKEIKSTLMEVICRNIGFMAFIAMEF